MIASPTLTRVTCLVGLLLLLTGPGVTSAGAQAERAGGLSGRVLDPSGAVVPGAAVVARTSDGTYLTAVADGGGRFLFPSIRAGRVEITADSPGFATHYGEAIVAEASHLRLEIRLDVGSLSETVQVVPERIVSSDETARRIPGSVDVLDLRALEVSRVFTTGEALRKVAGVNVRDEEGFGVRPNIGIRGLNPTRSARVLLLEDGIPLTFAPYGDNAAYYHPPVERFDRIELLKGSGQIAYGPMTVGGVINYLTPAPPGKSAGSLTLAGGSREYFNAHGGWGTTLGNTGLQLDFMRKQGAGARENVSSELNDLNAKIVSRLTARQVLTLRANYYGEDSNVTYSGLREDEYRANPRQNPFSNDFFYLDRYGASATHTLTLSRGLVATTNLYASSFRRHWWRQSSNSSQRPNDSADPACAGMSNLHTTCGNEGRLRQYSAWGLEPRVRALSSLGAVRNETDFGVRLHYEDQERRQENGDSPVARSGRLVENNERRNTAYSAFVQNRFVLGDWAITPGVRLERVNYERTNRLLDVTGRTHLTEIVPGIGASYSPTPRLTAFAGAHRGFAPPRTEDVINNTTGGVIDLDPERSWNYEIGVRTRPLAGLQADASFFRMDYENQIIPATLAGGVGSLLTNAGATLHQGLEASGRLDLAGLVPSVHNVYLRSSYTWLPLARFSGTRFSSVPGFTTTSVTGNRLPYAPRHLLNAGLGYTHPSGLDVNLEAVLIGDQFGDDLNTVAGSPDGQRGLLPGNTIWNAALNYPLPRGMRAFVAVKNVMDRTTIVDRSRGILPNAPRLVHLGVKVSF